jgi:hypothetical protein
MTSVDIGHEQPSTDNVEGNRIYLSTKGSKLPDKTNLPLSVQLLN